MTRPRPFSALRRRARARSSRVVRAGVSSDVDGRARDDVGRGVEVAPVGVGEQGRTAQLGHVHLAPHGQHALHELFLAHFQREHGHGTPWRMAALRPMQSEKAVLAILGRAATMMRSEGWRPAVSLSRRV